MDNAFKGTVGAVSLFGKTAGAVLFLVAATQGATAQQRLAPLGPTQDAQLGEAANALGAMNTIVLRGEPGRGGAGAVDLATRAPTLEMGGLFEGLAPSEVSFSSQGAGDVVITPWAELSALRSEDLLRSYDAQVLELGIDAVVTEGLTIGASVALVRSDTESILDAANTNGEGEGTIVTLFASYEAAGWTADAALRFGQTEYSQIFTGTAGTAESQAQVFRASISRELELGNGGILSPTAVLVTGRDEITGTGGGLAGAGTREVTFTEVSLGAVYAHDLGFGTASFGLFADNLDVSGDAGTVLIGLDRAGSSGRVEVGFDAALGNGLDLSAGVSYGGLGSDAEVMQGMFGLRYTF